MPTRNATTTRFGEAAETAIATVASDTNGTAMTLAQQLPTEIIDDAEYERVGAIVSEANSVSKRVEEWFAPMRTSAHRTWKALCDREKQVRAPLDIVVDAGRARLSAYVNRRAAARAVEAEAVAATIPAEFAQYAVRVTPYVAPPVAPGTSTRNVEHLDVDVHALCRAIVAGELVTGFVEPNMAMVRERVRVCRSNGNDLPSWVTVRHEQQVVLHRR